MTNNTNVVCIVTDIGVHCLEHLETNQCLVHSDHSSSTLYILLIASHPDGVARYCFHPVCLCVCLCVCVCVSGQYFGILFLGY